MTSVVIVHYPQIAVATNSDVVSRRRAALVVVDGSTGRDGWTIDEKTHHSDDLYG